MNTPRIAFLGGGNMATAIIGGILDGGVTEKQNIIVADIAPAQLEKVATKYGIETTPDNIAAIQGAQIVILAVKPQQAREVLANAQAAFTQNHLLISICAGLPTEQLEKIIPARVVRVMPNLPALVRCGVSAICLGTRSTADDWETTTQLFAAVGMTLLVPEDQMNEVTALSGSGPGYAFAFIEALCAGAAEMGLDSDVAQKMAIETLRGAATLAAQSEKSPGGLRVQVCSKGGTTVAGLNAMEEGGFTDAVIAGMLAARDRAKELET